MCKTENTTVNLNGWWIGGKRNGGWKHFYWSDGSVFLYRNWQKDRPDNSYDHEDCIEMRSWDWEVMKLTWNDRPCDDKAWIRLQEKQRLRMI